MASLSGQARRAATLKYQPERDQLRELMLQARENLVSGLLHNRSSTEGIVRGLSRARPQLAQSFAQLANDYAATDRELRANLKAVGANQTPQAAVVAAEAAGTKKRAASMGTQAVNEFTRRIADAQAGGVYNESNLRRQYSADAAKIGVRVSRLNSEQGTYAAQTLDSLKQEAAKTARSEASLAETQRHNRATETAAQRRIRISQQNANRAGKGKPAKSTYTPTQRRDFVTSVQEALGVARSVPKGHSDADLRRDLEQGTNPKKKSYDRWVVNAVMDIRKFGALHPANAAYWHHHKIPVPKRWRPALFDVGSPL